MSSMWFWSSTESWVYSGLTVIGIIGSSICATVIRSFRGDDD